MDTESRPTQQHAMPDPKVKTFCTTREAAMLLGVSVGTVQIWVERGMLKAWKTSGGHRRVMRDSVSDLLHQKPQVIAPVRPELAQFAAKGEPKMRRLSVLVLGDEPVFRYLYEVELQKWPMAPELKLVTNGMSALLMLGSYSPDLLITDLSVPQLDGFEMLRVIRSTPRLDRTTIVVVSGLDADQVAARGGLPDGIELLSKSAPFERLLAISHDLVNQRRLERRGN